MKKCVSILVPIFNEEEVLDHFFKEIEAVLQKVDCDYEIICVNDGSSDTSLNLLLLHHNRNKRIKVVNFSRNFGKEAAMVAALDRASGDACIPIDCDLQDPVSIIPQMLEKWNTGDDIVCARRQCRKSDSFFKRKSAHWFYKTFNRFSDVDIPENVGDYRLMDRKVIDVIKTFPERNRFMKGLYSWPGFKVSFIDYKRDERVAGSTKFNYWKLWNFALDGLTSFSTVPLRMSTYFGLAVSIGAFLYALFMIVKTLLMGIDVPGYASLIVIILFQFGIQMIALGILGEYIGRIYKEVKGRPLYVIAGENGFE